MRPRVTTTARMIMTIMDTIMIIATMVIAITTRIMIIITRVIMVMTITTTTNIPTRTIIGMASTTDDKAFAELPLLVWLSPAFPVGAFAYSHGLEWAVESGDVTNATTLGAWLEDLLAFGAPHNDAILFALAFRAAAAGEAAEVGRLNELAVALTGSAERRLETVAQGAAFIAAMRAAWTTSTFGLLPTQNDEPIAYPIVVALAAAGHGLPLVPSLQAFVLSFIANLVSAAVRLGPIGQSDGQRVIAALLPNIRRLAGEAAQAGLDDLGGCAFRSDIAAMRHETQYSRLFRS